MNRFTWGEGASAYTVRVVLLARLDKTTDNRSVFTKSSFGHT